MRFFPAVCVISLETLIKRIRKRWILGVSSSKRLVFNSTNDGLWSISTVNLCSPIRKSANFSQHQVTARTSFSIWAYLCSVSVWDLDALLYIDFRPGQTCHSKVMHRKEVTHSDGSYEKKSRRWAWLKKWDKVKSLVTLIDWCTGREWPVNCMTVISAWWRSNMPFQRLSGRLNYYITRWRQEVSKLEIRWVRDKVW